MHSSNYQPWENVVPAFLLDFPQTTIATLDGDQIGWLLKVTTPAWLAEVRPIDGHLEFTITKHFGPAPGAQELEQSKAEGHAFLQDYVAQQALTPSPSDEQIHQFPKDRQQRVNRIVDRLMETAKG